MEGESNDYMSKPENWKELKDSSGRPYYYNKIGNATQWEKPECLGGGTSASESNNWMEYKTEDGRTYYFNSVTKACLWNLPEEVKSNSQKAPETPIERKEEEAKETKSTAPSQEPIVNGLGLGLVPRIKLPIKKNDDDENGSSIFERDSSKIKPNTATAGIKISLVLLHSIQLFLNISEYQVTFI